MIRSTMIRILLGREFRRLQKNPSALMLIGLLSAVALLIATSRPIAQQANDAAAGRKPATLAIWLIVDEPLPWLPEVVARAPESLVVRRISRSRLDEVPELPAGEHAVEIRAELITTDTTNKTGSPLDLLNDESETAQMLQLRVVGRYRGADPKVLDPFWKWFWPALSSMQAGNVAFVQDAEPLGGAAIAQQKSLEETSVAELVKAELIGTSLVLMVEFFACCHLLVSFTSQDRERGTLSSLVLSPARVSEILFARYLFHLILSLGGSLIIVAILQPLAMTQPLLWAVMILTSLGLMSVGTCISTLVKTQSSAALLALCYMLAGAVLFYLSGSFKSFAVLRLLAFENYSFPLLYATFKAPTSLMAAPGLLNMALLVGMWIVVARNCFYRYGWR